MPNRNQGFTLVELLITLTLLILTANIALPAFKGFIDHNRQQALMEQVDFVLNSARAEAVMRRRAIEVCGSSDGQICSSNWADGWLVRTSDGQILQTARLPTHDKLRWSGFQNSIRFRDNGSSPTGNGRFYQCLDEQIAWQLILNRQGRLRRSTQAENTSSTERCSS